MTAAAAILPRPRHFLLAAPIVALLLGSLLTPFYLLDIRQHEEIISVRDRLALRAAANLVEEELRRTVALLPLLADHTSFHLEQWGRDFSHLGREYLFYLGAGPYDQLRFLDLQGRERARVERSGGGAPQVVPPEELQDESGRDYFREALGLGPGDVYLSRLDPNVERGGVERQERVVMRFATQVFDREGHGLGLLVVNYPGQALFRLLEPAGLLVTDQLLLLDRRGGELMATPPAQIGAGPVGDFSTRFPTVWRALEGAEGNGRVFTEEGLFSSLSLTLPSVSELRGTPRWSLVARVCPEHLMELRSRSRERFLWLFTALFLPGLGIGALLVRSRCRQQALQEELEGQSRRLEREVAERTAELAGATARLRGIIDHADDAILVGDEQGRFVDVNRSACRMLGYPRDELLRLGIEQVTPGLAETEVRALLERAAAGTVQALEVRHRGKEGGELPVELRVTCYHEGEALRFVAVARDIRRRKLAEAALQRAHHALKTLSGVNRALAWAGDESTLLQEVCDIVVGLGDYRFVWVGYARADGSVEPVRWAGYESDYLKQVRIAWEAGPEGLEPMGRAIREGTVAVVHDVAADPGLGPLREAARRRGYRSILALPLAGEGQPLGGLAIYSGDPDAFDAEETELLSELAGNLAYGIAALRHRLAQRRTEQELRREHRLLERVIDLSPAAILVADRAGNVLFANRRGLEVLGAAREELGQRNLWTGDWQMSDLDGVPFPVDQSPLTRVFGSRDSVYDLRFRVARPDGRRILLSVNGAPVLNDQGRIERLVFTFEDISERLQAELERDRALADNRRLTRRLFQAQEEERREIAADLHDDLGQMLVAMKTELALVRNGCRAVGSPPGCQMERECVSGSGLGEMIEQTRGVVRRIVQRLRPAQLEKLGLRNSVEGMVRDWRRRRPEVEWALSLTGDLDGVEPEVALAAFRVLQEGITNIAKYARASSVRIRLERRPGELELELADDGRGILPAAIGGLGQLGMRERVVALGGTFRLETAPGLGVTIMARIPLTPAAGGSDEE